MLKVQAAETECTTVIMMTLPRSSELQMVERKNERELRQEEVPSFLFRLVDFVRDKSEWTGTATELISVLGENVSWMC